ncbi:MAG: hypothetical protein HON90_12585 [Halobacteriovoraceae bacterium]|jgi:hypothetical protein|nr:hypothetical protein [Candidatus Falkowbacteria bacterium]MBT4792400.1 hypothetical protein [Halobacteriovoraceae bacterium]
MIKLFTFVYFSYFSQALLANISYQNQDSPEDIFPHNYVTVKFTKESARSLAKALGFKEKYPAKVCKNFFITKFNDGLTGNVSLPLAISPLHYSGVIESKSMIAIDDYNFNPVKAKDIYNCLEGIKERIYPSGRPFPPQTDHGMYYGDTRVREFSISSGQNYFNLSCVKMKRFGNPEKYNCFIEIPLQHLQN